MRGGVNTYREYKAVTSQQANSSSLSNAGSSEKNLQVDAESVAVSSNQEKTSSLLFDEKEFNAKASKGKAELEAHFDYGTNAPFAVDTNANTQSVATALRNPSQYPERLSVLVQPKPFDLAAFTKDPQTYLSVIEPARVFQTAQPSKESPAIQRISAMGPTIKQGSSTILQVKVLPNMPATFTTFDLGRFENDLTTITVQANSEGLASCTFTDSVGPLAELTF